MLEEACGEMVRLPTLITPHSCAPPTFLAPWAHRMHLLSSLVEAALPLLLPVAWSPLPKHMRVHTLHGHHTLLTSHAHASGHHLRPHHPFPPSHSQADDADAADKGGGDLGFEASAFEALEKDFQEVLTDLVGDKSLERFRTEYEKLHKALKKSHEQEKRLIRRCRELNTEIVGNAQKVQTALKLSQEDQHTIGQLKKEIESAWKMVDASHEKEQRAKDTIQELKVQITQLGRLVEQGAGLSIGQDNTVQELLKVRDELTRQNEEQEGTIKQLKEHMNTVNGRVLDMEKESEGFHATIKELQDEILQKKNEQEREQRRKERLDKELKDIKTQLDAKGTESAASAADLEGVQEHNRKLEAQLKDTRNTMEKQVSAMDSLYGKTQKLAEDLEDQVQQNLSLEKEVHNGEGEIKSRELETLALTNDKAALKRRLDKEKKTAKNLRLSIDDERTQKEVVQAELHSFQKELDAGHRREEELVKQVENGARQVEIKERANVREVERAKQQGDLVAMQERQCKALENDIHQYIEEAAKKRKIIYQLEKAREKYGIEASEANARYQAAMEQVKLKEMRITEQGKKVGEGAAKLKQQQQLYEAVRSDRNLYSKNLIESNDAIAEMRRKFKIMNHQIEQLKEEITAKDHALTKEHFDHQRELKHKEQLKNELGKMKKLLETNQQGIDAQNAELLKLTNMISQMDQIADTQRNQFEQVVNERDILGTQLIRRNDELALLYEKIKIQQSTLRKGEGSYTERLQDIRILKLKLSDTLRELHITKNKVGRLDDLKRDVYHLQRELLQEKTKVKALSEELENPMNVHRWRKLEGSDPATYEMIQKIQTLQKRLISKTEEVVEKDLLIQEKDKLYIELKNILARQPGPEVAEQLSVYQQNLKEKTRQMKAMASELNMHQAQINEYKYEMERLKRELQNVKRKYYEQKRREQMRREILLKSAPDGSPMGGGNGAGLELAQQQQQAAAAAATSRFTGGGFNLTS